MNMEAAGLKSVLVCIDNYDDGLMKGRIHALGMEGYETFDNLMQMIEIMKTYSSDVEDKDVFKLKNSFTESPVNVESESHSYYSGDRATFFVKILFTQNESWQGSVRWIEEEKEESFRSVLELLFLMNGALNKL